MKRRKCDGGPPLAMMARHVVCIECVASVYAVAQRRGRFWNVWDESLGRAQRRLGGLRGLEKTPATSSEQGRLGYGGIARIAR